MILCGVRRFSVFVPDWYHLNRTPNSATLSEMGQILKDKVIFITGASSGIGRETARLAARYGMHIALAARRQNKLEQVADEITAMGCQALAITCDVTHDDQTRDALQKAFDHFGRLDVLFANAGYGYFSTVDEMPEAEHRAMFETNYFGTLRTLIHGLPFLRQTSDGLKQILICSSAASEIGLPMFGAYSATKAAQDSIAGAMRAELAVEGIRVTSVHPVGTKTEFFQTAGKKSDADALQHNAPDLFTQSSQHVAKRIVKAIEKPHAEVWPNIMARFGLAGATAMPGMTAWVMRRHVKKLISENKNGRS